MFVNIVCTDMDVYVQRNYAFPPLNFNSGHYLYGSLVCALETTIQKNNLIFQVHPLHLFRNNRFGDGFLIFVILSHHNLTQLLKRYIDKLYTFCI